MKTPGRTTRWCIALASSLCDAILLIVFLTLGTIVSSRASEAQRRALILHPFNFTFPATLTLSDALCERLVEHFSLEIEIHASFIDFMLVHRDVLDPAVPIEISGVTRTTFEAVNEPSDVTAVIGEYSPGSPLEVADRLQSRAAVPVDARAMEHHGIDRDRLSAGSSATVHEPGVWEQHRIVVSTIGVLVSL